MSNTIINGGASPYPKHVGPAAICSFSDGAQDAPLKSLKFYIEPSQDLHGYSYPWPGGGGKNKLAIRNEVVEYKGITATPQSDGTIKVNGTATALADIQVAGGVTSVPLPSLMTTPGSSFKYNGGVIGLNGSSGNTLYLTIRKVGATTDARYVGNNSSTYASVTLAADEVVYAVFIRIASGTTASNAIFKPMVVEGSVTDTTFEPYSNICPISGWSQVDGTRSGVNLLPDSGSMASWTPSSTVTISDGVATCVGSSSNYDTALSTAKMGIELFDGTTQYVFSFWYKSTASCLVQLTLCGTALNKTDSGVTRSKYTAWVSNPTLPSTNGEWVRYVAPARTIALSQLTSGSGNVNSWLMRWYVRSNTTIQIKQARMERGSTATPYADAHVQYITISLGQTVYGGTVDAIAGKCYARPYYASYSGQALVGPWISSHDKYVAGGTPTTGAQVVDMGGTETTLSLTPVSVNSLLGQNNIWCNTGDTELDYYPAAASVVAVLNKSSKVYTSIPLGKIRYDTYQTTPNQALDLDSYRAETGVLIRNVLSHTATKIEFNTPSMTNAQWEEVWNIIKAGFNNSTERKLKLKYYDQMSATYKTGWFYVPDVQFTIRNIDEAAGIINYDEVRVAFIEY